MAGCCDRWALGSVDVEGGEMAYWWWWVGERERAACAGIGKVG